MDKLFLRLRLFEYLNHFVWDSIATCEFRCHHEELELGTQNSVSPTLQLVVGRTRLLLYSVASKIVIVIK